MPVSHNLSPLEEEGEVGADGAQAELTAPGAPASSIALALETAGGTQAVRLGECRTPLVLLCALLLLTSLDRTVSHSPADDHSAWAQLATVGADADSALQTLQAMIAAAEAAKGKILAAKQQHNRETAAPAAPQAPKA